MNTIRDLDILESAMSSIGFELTHSESGPMDSGVAIFTKEGKEIEITKDRSQWMFSQPRKTLEPLGLFKAFDSTEEFKEALLLLALK